MTQMELIRGLESGEYAPNDAIDYCKGRETEDIERLVEDMELTCIAEYSMGNTDSITKADRLHEAIEVICKRFNVRRMFDFDDDKYKKAAAVVLPKELQTKAAEEILQKSIELGFLDGQYRWNKEFTFADAGFYIAEFSKKLDLGKWRKDERGVNWKIFEFLGVDTNKAKAARNEYHNTGSKPQHNKELDQIFGN